jgi:hypothetical protein
VLIYQERQPTAAPTPAQRSPMVQTLLLGMGIAYVNVAIFMMVFSEPPQMHHFLWAAGLGIGAGLLTCRRAPQAEPQGKVSTVTS